MLDIQLALVCPTCGTTRPFREIGERLLTLSEGTTVMTQLHPQEGGLCFACGNLVYLQIKAQPYEMEHHLDNPVIRNIYEQGLTTDSTS